ncbi:alpha/beta hydrolase [Ktedonosporobacter rubrisoli]|uniref:Alpha/beta hydrolase n=1 Tax=Ktedonosporobacter rubrisoli TaxID=2509675 RepID=A0A4P6JZN8_KTERU|nr:alpha/beta hydrolase [Ktedonosporobacter rubrisoli]QBD81297.1 alpha/beta hydrolase [Ktedonosporobacter rubrisoli]
MMATYVFVAGGGWGGFIWREVASRLRGHGHEAFTPTLTGVGERVHLASPQIDLETHVQDILGVLEYEDLHKVILVGHSYGGTVITAVAERVPERLAQLVYLNGLIPQDGQSAWDVTDPGLRARMQQRVREQGDGWRLLPPPGAPARITAHPFKPLTQPLTIQNPAAARLPHTFVYCTQIRVKGKLTIDAIAARVRAEGWHFYEVEADHMAMVTAPKAVTDILLEISEAPWLKSSRETV